MTLAPRRTPCLHCGHDPSVDERLFQMALKRKPESADKPREATNIDRTWWRNQGSDACIDRMIEILERAEKAERELAEYKNFVENHECAPSATAPWYATFRKLTDEELMFGMNFSAKVDQSRGAKMNLDVNYLAKIADLVRMAVLWDKSRKEHEAAPAYVERSE